MFFKVVAYNLVRNIVRFLETITQFLGTCATTAGENGTSTVTHILGCIRYVQVCACSYTPIQHPRISLTLTFFWRLQSSNTFQGWENSSIFVL